MVFGTLSYFSWIQDIAPKSTDLLKILYFTFHLTCMSETAGTFQKAMGCLYVGNWTETLFYWCLLKTCVVFHKECARHRVVKAVFAKLSSSYRSVLKAIPFTATSINLTMYRIDWYSIVLLQWVWENLCLYYSKRNERHYEECRDKMQH